MQRLSTEDTDRQRVNILLLFSVQLQNDGYQNDENINGDRILLLEQQITQLNRMVDMLKAQVQTYGQHRLATVSNIVMVWKKTISINLYS